MRIGIFGGSFDPIHFGHLILAEHCLHQIPVDEIHFVPASTAPHKEKGAAMNDRQRTETIKLAIGGNPKFKFSDTELKRGGVSYTVDTLEELHNEHPDAELFLLMGRDSLDNFHSWRQPDRICELAVPVVVGRPDKDQTAGGRSAGDQGMPDLSLLKPHTSADRFALFEKTVIRSPLVNISSSEIRRRFASGESSRYLLPRGVEKYIETAGIYQPKPGK